MFPIPSRCRIIIKDTGSKATRAVYCTQDEQACLAINLHKSLTLCDYWGVQRERSDLHGLRLRRQRQHHPRWQDRARPQLEHAQSHLGSVGHPGTTSVGTCSISSRECRPHLEAPPHNWRPTTGSLTAPRTPNCVLGNYHRLQAYSRPRARSKAPGSGWAPRNIMYRTIGSSLPPLSRKVRRNFAATAGL